MQQSWKIAFAYIGVIVGAGLSSGQDPVSYTHLDVYKRQL